MLLRASVRLDVAGTSAVAPASHIAIEAVRRSAAQRPAPFQARTSSAGHFRARRNVLAPDGARNLIGPFENHGDIAEALAKVGAHRLLGIGGHSIVGDISNRAQTDR